MPLENNLPPEHDLDREAVMFMGVKRYLRRLNAYDIARLVKIFNLVRDKAGIHPEQFQQAFTLKLGFDLAMALVKFASDCIDLDKEDLSLEGKWIFQEIGRYFEGEKVAAEQVATASLDELMAVIELLLRQERDGAVGKRVTAIVAVIQRQLQAVIAVLKYRSQASAGGTADGGTTGSSIPSEAPMDGPMITSSDSPLVESSTLSAA